MNKSTRMFVRSLLAAAVVATAAPAANALDVYLEAMQFTKQLPNGTPTPTTVTMWGYRDCGTSFTGCTTTPSSPGPAITVPSGDSTLRIVLKNSLPVPVTPNDNLPRQTSIMIPGLTKALTPVRFLAGQFAGRIRSFDAEVAPGAERTFEWTGVRPGTYLYHSATHPQVQVQMGLHGALVRNDSDTAKTAYAGVGYDTQALLVFGEIDPDLHAAVAANTYGTATGPTSTIGFAPRYFLINGEPYTAATPHDIAANNGRDLLLRLVNAGIENHAPQLLGGHYRVIAEDGVALPVAQRHLQYNSLLPAGKTLDVVLNTANGVYPLFDRRLRLTNDTATGGGMLARISVTGVAPPPPGAPVANPDVYAATEDTSLVVSVAGPPAGVLGNDTDPNGLALSASVTTPPTNGTITLNANGSFTYAPTLNSNGADSFSYVASNGTLASAPTTVTLNVAPVNDAPVADADVFFINTNTTPFTVAAPGVLDGDTDVDNTTASLTAVARSGVTTANGAGAASVGALGTDGSFSVTQGSTSGQGFVGTLAFTYRASDPASAQSAPADVVVAKDFRLRVVATDGNSTVVPLNNNTTSSRYVRPYFLAPQGAWVFRGVVRAMPGAATQQVTLRFNYGATASGPLIATRTVNTSATAPTNFEFLIPATAGARPANNVPTFVSVTAVNVPATTIAPAPAPVIGLHTVSIENIAIPQAAL